MLRRFGGGAIGLGLKIFWEKEAETGTLAKVNAYPKAAKSKLASVEKGVAGIEWGEGRGI